MPAPHAIGVSMCALVLMFCITRHVGGAWKIMMGAPASAGPVHLNNGNLSADPRLALLPQSRPRSTGGACVDMEGTGTNWTTVHGAKASCTELHRYCSHTKHGGGIKQVCPATCGVCSGGCADGCGWTKKWPCPEDPTESAKDVCFNLCCISFKPPSYADKVLKGEGFTYVLAWIWTCAWIASFVVFPQEDIRPTGLPIAILTPLFFMLLFFCLIFLAVFCSDSFLVDADLDRVVLTGLPNVVVSVLQLFFTYTVFLHEMLPVIFDVAFIERWISKISDNIIIHYIIYLILLLASVLLPARMMTMAMSLKSDTSEEESEIAFYLYVIVVQVIWTAAIWVYKGGVLEWDAKPRKCFVDVWAKLFWDEAPYIHMPRPGNDEENVAQDRARAEHKARASMDEDGFALIQLYPNDRKNKRLLATLQALLDNTDARHLGQGKDIQQKYGAYDRLQLACAWKIDNPKLSEIYEAGKEYVQKDMDLLRSRGMDVTTVPGLPVKTAQVSGSFSFTQGANEVMLLHGTNPSVLEEILTNGLNPRLSGSNAGTAFGEGIYLAEDVGKTDQYVTADSKYGDHITHERLYGSRDSTGPERHPGDVFYVLAVRVVLGYPVRTQEAGPKACEMKGLGVSSQRERVFPTTFKELNYIPDVRPKMHYHSLIAEMGVAIHRYREFVVFRDCYVLPEYLIAYHRFHGNRKLTTH